MEIKQLQPNQELKTLTLAIENLEFTIDRLDN
jgi:hypothetical protein